MLTFAVFIIRANKIGYYRACGGLFGQAVIYTEHFHHAGIMRKVTRRMAAWMNYVLPFH